MTERHLVPADRPWAKAVGYSRAVPVGNVVEVSGTAPAGPDGEILHPGDVEAQARAALRIIGEALAQAGASFEDVVRTRIFLTSAAHAADVLRAHREAFPNTRPATSGLVVGLLDPRWMVEIEADALLSG